MGRNEKRIKSISLERLNHLASINVKKNTVRMFEALSIILAILSFVTLAQHGMSVLREVRMHKIVFVLHVFLGINIVVFIHELGHILLALTNKIHILSLNVYVKGPMLLLNLDYIGSASSKTEMREFFAGGILINLCFSGLCAILFNITGYMFFALLMSLSLADSIINSFPIPGTDGYRIITLH